MASSTDADLRGDPWLSKPTLSRPRVHRRRPPDRWPASVYSRARQCWLGQPRVTSQIGISRRRHEASPTMSNRVIPVIRNSSNTEFIAHRWTEQRWPLRSTDGPCRDRPPDHERRAPAYAAPGSPVATILGLLGEGLTPADVPTIPNSSSRTSSPCL